MTELRTRGSSDRLVIRHPYSATLSPDDLRQASNSINENHVEVFLGAGTTARQGLIDKLSQFALGLPTVYRLQSEPGYLALLKVDTAGFTRVSQCEWSSTTPNSMFSRGFLVASLAVSTFLAGKERLSGPLTQNRRRASILAILPFCHSVVAQLPWHLSFFLAFATTSMHPVKQRYQIHHAP